MTLADPVSGLSSIIQPRDGVSVMTLDVQPGVRAQSDPVPGGDGENDVSEFLAAAALTLTNDQWASPRTLTLRFDSKTAPVDNPVSADVAISWKVPSGVWQDAAPVEYDLAALLAPTGGLHLAAGSGLHSVPVTGVHLTASSGLSPSLVTVAGSAPPPWKAKLYGPCVGPKLANDTAGLDIAFLDSLVLAAGQYVEISSGRTANLLSDPAQSQLGLLDFAHTSWWALQPGVTNFIRYHPTSGAGSGAVLTFSPARLA